MSKSKAINKFNFYFLFLVSIGYSFVITIIESGYQIPSHHSLKISAFAGNFCGNLAFILGLPLFIAFLVKIVSNSIMKSSKENISYTIVWVLFLFISFSVLLSIFFPK